MPKVRIRSRIELRGINPYILVERKFAERLRKVWRKAMPVRLRVDGADAKWWSTNLIPAGNGSFYLYLHGGIRRASGIDVGDSVSVELQFDSNYQAGPVHPMPPSLRLQLMANPDAEQAWSALAPSRKKEILRYLAALKSPQAIDRNIGRTIEVLSGANRRFLARDWNASS